LDHIHEISWKLRSSSNDDAKPKSTNDDFDWQIQIVAIDNDIDSDDDDDEQQRQIQIYDIHQHIMCSGECCSLALASELQNSKLPIRIYLPNEMTAMIPKVLNYCYFSDLDLKYDVSTNEAMQLYCLAEYLDIPALRHDIEVYYTKDVFAKLASAEKK